MLYRQIIQTCFESHVGEHGLSDADFRELQEQTGPIVTQPGGGQNADLAGQHRRLVAEDVAE